MGPCTHRGCQARRDRNAFRDNLQAAQRIATASLVSAAQSSPAATQKGIGVTVATAPGTKTLTAAQLQYYRQQQVLLRQQQLKVLQAQAAVNGQKVSVAVPAAAAQQRATLMKQNITAGTVAQATVGKQTVARTVSETEMAALIKRQALQQQAKAVAQVQVPAQTGLTPAQIFAQAGLQVQAGTSASGTPVATLVKTANVASVRTANTSTNPSARSASTNHHSKKIASAESCTTNASRCENWCSDSN